MTRMMTPGEIVQSWVDTFNRADAAALAEYYAQDAVNHQVALEPVTGKPAIRAMFEAEFARTPMVCIPENLFEDGDWAILEWRDPYGFRGCGFFHIRDGKIVFQRGYWDALSFAKSRDAKP
jgi:limonene-1,2-epoxide hydrolase